MRVTGIESSNREGWHELSAEIVFEESPHESHRVWLRAPGEREPTPTPGDVFVPGLLPPCLVLGERLLIDAPVSAEILEAARQRIAPVLSGWYTRGVEVPIECSSVVARPLRERRGRTGAFFSGGVDSWYTLLRNADRIESLVHVRGFEIDPGNETLGRLASAHAESIARDHGMQLHPILTNLRDVGSRATMARLHAQQRPWRYFGVDCYFGSLLVALGNFVSADFERLLVAASWPSEHSKPHGSHSLIEPRWSSPQLAFELDGADAGRAQKLREIRRRAADAPSRIRVCHSQQGDRLNCGRCYKCIRTLLEMRAAGLGDEIPGLFAHPPSLAQIRRRPLPRDDFFWPDLLREAEAAGDAELARTVRIIQGERFHWPRAAAQRGGRLARRVRRGWGRLTSSQP